MKQAQVTVWGEAPKCVSVPDLPAASSGQVQIRVLAAGLHNLVRSRAAGKHYSAQGLPHTPGVDGVGTTADGRLVYFATLTPTGGSFAETVNVPIAATTPVPAGADAVQVAGLLNLVMASWMALATRTTALPAGFTAVVVGATSLSGAAAVSVARAFGAARVVGVARNAAKMAPLGLDAAVELADDPDRTDYAAALDADVILDFLYGPPMLALFRALGKGKPVQYVQCGTVVERSMDFPGDVLRSKDITLRGTGPGAWRMEQFAEHSPRMVEAIASGKIAPHKFQEVKLEDVEEAWARKGGDRMVIVP
ncbi:Alcohol dehydrogenase superfamily zinc-containing [Neofusicoccum parvum]|nr:Alcohol dehydrogenase superfamily zinc-containing [Neofusicoccum parvum]